MLKKYLLIKGFFVFGTPPKTKNRYVSHSAFPIFCQALLLPLSRPAVHYRIENKKYKAKQKRPPKTTHRETYNK